MCPRLFTIRLFCLLSRCGCRRGSLLLEAVISVLVFSVVGTGVLSGLSVAHTSGAVTQTQTTARYSHLLDDPLRDATEEAGNAFEDARRTQTGKVVPLHRSDAGQNN